MPLAFNPFKFCFVLFCFSSWGNKDREHKLHAANQWQLSSVLAKRPLVHSYYFQLMCKGAHKVSRYSRSVVSRTFYRGLQGEETMTALLWTSQFQHSPLSLRAGQLTFKKQVPVANPNNRKCFLAPKGYKISLWKVKKNRNRIPCNALFTGQSHLLRLVFCAWFCQVSLKDGDRVYRERNSGWCQLGFLSLRWLTEKTPWKTVLFRAEIKCERKQRLPKITW